MKENGEGKQQKEMRGELSKTSTLSQKVFGLRSERRLMMHPNPAIAFDEVAFDH
jgi:hypothetical protein